MAGKKTAPRMSDEAVRTKTGRIWKEWFAVLDRAGARKMTHTRIAAHLHEKEKVSGWWSQMVAVEYEHARGMRQELEGCDGTFAATGSRVVAAPLPRLFRAWQDEKARGVWLKESGMVVRKATPGKSMRILWTDGKTRVDVYFTGKGKDRSQVTVEHRNLPDRKAAEKMKSYWAGALDALKGALES